VARDGKISMSVYNELLDESKASGDDTALTEYLKEAVKGARVGMQVGTAYWSWFLGFLETIGLTADDVTIIPLDFNVQVAALDKGEVDMISGGSPNTENALSLISDGFMIQDPDKKLASIFLMASGSAQAAKADAIVKVLNGLQRACDFIYSNPEEAARIIIDTYGRNWSVQQQMDVFNKSIWGIDTVDADIGALVTAASLINNAGQERKGPLPDTEAVIKERVFRVFMLDAGLPTDGFVIRESEAGIDPHYTEL
jgi:ABC-type nitrate/sulfonate/bicarbonate transport system substrate-binding protein